MMPAALNYHFCVCFDEKNENYYVRMFDNSASANKFPM